VAPQREPVRGRGGRETQPQVLLDWATISYRSIMRGVVLLVIVAAAGGAWLYFRSTLHGSPEELALVDIGRAERLYSEAQAAAGTDGDRLAAVGRVNRLLNDARLAYDRRNYPEARAAAQQSQTFAEKILEGQQGESFAARIFKFEGDVKVKRAREFVWASLSGNTALRVGDQIKTAGSGSAQIIYFDGTITTIKPGSLLEIRELFEDPSTRVRKVEEKVNWGGISATTAEANVQGSVHSVLTDSTTTRATSRASFDVSFDADRKSASTEVHSGATELEAAGTTHTLNPLDRVDVQGEKIVARSTLPASPALLDPTDSRVFVAANGSPEVSLRWSSVAEAGRYRLQLARTALFSSLLLDKPDVRSTTVRLPGMGEGTYYWRVAATSAQGIESGFSEIRRFKVDAGRERAADDRTPPPLQIAEFLPSGHLLIINGRTEPGSTLSVEGQAIDVYDDGTFTAVIRMKHEGKNDVAIVAQDAAGNETRLRKSVFVESY
jgi:hypothetical protein